MSTPPISTDTPSLGSFNPLAPFEGVTRVASSALEGVAGYFLKISLFRNAVLQGPAARYIVTPFVRAVFNLWIRFKGGQMAMTPFDPQRARRSEALLQELAPFEVLPSTGDATIRLAHFTPDAFYRWVDAHGGRLEGDHIVPQTPADWPRLQRLAEFKCFPRDGESFRIPPFRPENRDTCVLHCPGFGRTLPNDKPLIALHLAAGFQYAVFDYREDPSLKGYYEDAETAYQALRARGIPAHSIKAVGACRATFAVAELKTRHHAEGLDAVFIHAPPSLREAIAVQPFPANRLGLCGLPAVEQEGATCETIRKLEALPPADSRLCLILSEADQTVPADTRAQFRAAATRIGPFTDIPQPRPADGSDPHFDEPLFNPDVQRAYFEFLHPPE